MGISHYMHHLLSTLKKSYSFCSVHQNLCCFCLLASTSIETTSEVPDGYSSAGVISVSGAMFKRGDLAVPINEGLCYALDQVTGLEFKGSRLVEKFIGENPVFITFINADGEEVEYQVKPPVPSSSRMMPSALICAGSRTVILRSSISRRLS